MNKRSSLILVLLLIILLASIGFNIYLFTKNQDLEARIKTFIPAAMSLETENARLLEKEKTQQEKLDELTYFQDSILQVFKTDKPAPNQNPAYLPGSPATSVPIDPAQQQPAPTGGFKDLNKGIQ